MNSATLKLARVSSQCNLAFVEAISYHHGAVLVY